MAAVTLSPIQRQLKRSNSEIAASWHGSLNIKANSNSMSSYECSSDSTPNISSIEIEQKIQNKVKSHYKDLLQAFQTYDVDKNLSVTRGEFRRVLELFCVPLTTSQFNTLMGKISVNRNSTVRYTDFLNKFYGVSATPHLLPPRASPSDNLTPVQHNGFLRPQSFLGTPCPASRMMSRNGTPKTPQVVDTLTTEQLVARLRETAMVAGRPRSLVKALRLFDFNRDNKIQRHELRKVLDNYCFVMSESQFDKLWHMFDFTNSGVINYVEFLNFLGITSEMKSAPEVKAAVNRLSIGSANAQPKNLDQMEVEFRKKIRSDFGILQKAFLAFDPKKTGFVTLDNLQSVLSQFIMPMGNELFCNLMERCGFKATGKIAWLTFLQKFQDPQGLTNGQTIPIKYSHKANPIQGVDRAATLDQLLLLLRNHMANSYSSMREAFLQIDTNRRGKIKRKDLKRLFDQFKFQISEEQFKELMVHLDSDNSGEIRYQRFIRLFEDKEDIVSHKWLKSNHRYNSSYNIGRLAPESVEALLQEKLTKNWSDLVTGFRQLDPSGRAVVKVDSLRKLVEHVCGFKLEDAHYESLTTCLSTYDSTSGCLNYLEFLHMLGVEGKPGDVQGVAEQITQENDVATYNRMQDHENRMKNMTGHAQERTGSMSIEELVSRLKDRFAQQNVNIRDAFNKFSVKGNGGITKREFRKVLANNFGLQFGDEHFAQLAAYLGFEGKSRMPYTRFLTALECVGRPSTEMTPSLIRKSNHRVNPIRGDEFAMTADQMAVQMKEKIRDNFSNLRDAFHKFDEGNQGYLDKETLRRILDHFMFVTNNEEFSKFCDKLGVDDKSHLSYHQFKDLFEIRETDEGHKWLTSDHRYNQVKPTPTLSAEQIAKLLPVKVHQEHSQVSRAFCRTDPQGQGYITKKYFKELLAKLQLQTDSEEFKKLWAFYDPSGRNSITWPAFLRRMGMGEAFGNSDTTGPSSNIIQGSHQTVADHLRGQMDRHNRNTENQAKLGSHLTNDKIIKSVRQRIRDFSGTQAAFKYYDTNNKGVVDVDDLRRLLNDIHIFLNDEQFISLARKLGLNSPEDTLSYERFCLGMEDPSSGPTVAASTGGLCNQLASGGGQVARKASGYQIETKLKQVISTQPEIIKKACQSFDQDNTGKIKSVNFRHILNSFCFRMTDFQFEQIIDKYQENDQVDYSTFLEQFRRPNTNIGAAEWLDSIQKRYRDKSPVPLAIDQVCEKVRECVNSRPQLFSRSFEELDVARIGVVSKTEFRESIVNQHIMRMTDDQFDKLWAELPVNEFNNLDYQTFLTKCSEPPKATEPSPPDTPDKDGDTLTSLMDDKRQQLEENKSPSSTIFENKFATAQDVSMPASESQLRDCLSKCWHRIHTQCKEIDVGPKIGYVGISEFLDIIRQVGGPSLLPCDLVPLISRHSLLSNGTFQYQNFLKNMVLLSNNDSKNETKSNAVRKLHTAGVNVAEDAMPGMLRLRSHVLASWKTLRKTFRSADSSSCGLLPVGQWRRILADSGLLLTEEEFYHLASHFDDGRLGKIDYNTFIKTVLKTN